MASVGDTWNTVAAKWTELHGQIGDTDWDKPSTCEGWNVRDVVDHANSWQVIGGNTLGAEIAEGADWSSIQPAMAAALADPSNLEGKAEGFGGMPKQGVAGMVIGDLLVHCWDVARSLGLDETLPEDAVTSTLMGLQRMPDEVLRSDKMFGPAIPVADDASAQDKLLGFVGRQP